MPNFGLSKPWMAKYDPETNSYSNGFKCGRAVNTAVTPNYNQAEMWADNQQTEKVSEFKNANVALSVDRLPIDAGKVLFGHTVSGEGEEVSNSGDSSGYVGYAFITAEMQDGKKKYRACLLHKVKFEEGEESFETKGDSIVFKNPSLSGTAMVDEDGNWRTKSPYCDTEDEADKWIKKKLNVTADDGE